MAKRKKKSGDGIGGGDLVALTILAGVGFLVWQNREAIAAFFRELFNPDSGGGEGPGGNGNGEDDPLIDIDFDAWREQGADWTQLGITPTVNPASIPAAAAQVEAALAAGSLLGLGSVFVPLTIGLSPEVADAVHAANVFLTSDVLGLETAEEKGNQYLFHRTGPFMWNARVNRCFTLSGRERSCPPSSEVYGAAPVVLEAYSDLTGV